MPFTCVHCGEPSPNIKPCKCGVVHYCSKECRRNYHPSHKDSCASYRRVQFELGPGVSWLLEKATAEMRTKDINTKTLSQMPPGHSKGRLEHLNMLIKKGELGVHFCHCVLRGDLVGAIKCHRDIQDCDIELLDLASEAEDIYTYVEDDTWTKEQRQQVEQWKLAFNCHQALIQNDRFGVMKKSPPNPPSFVSFGFKEGARCTVGKEMPKEVATRKEILDDLAICIRALR